MGLNPWHSGGRWVSNPLSHEDYFIRRLFLFALVKEWLTRMSSPIFFFFLGAKAAHPAWWRYAASFFRRQTRYRHHGLKLELTWLARTCARVMSEVKMETCRPDPFCTGCHPSDVELKTTGQEITTAAAPQRRSVNIAVDIRRQPAQAWQARAEVCSVQGGRTSECQWYGASLHCHVFCSHWN